MNGGKQRACVYLLVVLFLFQQAFLVKADELTISMGEFAIRINTAMGYGDQKFAGAYEEYMGQAAVIIGKLAGYLSGDEKGSNDHTKAVTNAEAAVIFAKVTGYDTTIFASNKEETGNTPSWARPALALCKYLELPMDYEHPETPIDRYNALALLSYMKAAAREDKENPYHVDLVPPEENFYKWVNNPWLLRMAVERQDSTVSRFTEAEENVNGQIEALIQSYVENQAEYPKTSDEWKIAEIYQLALDEKTRNAQGMQPVSSYLRRLEEAKDIPAIRSLLAEIGRDFGQPVFFQYAVVPSAKNSNTNELQLMGPALSLGDASYYDGKDKDTSKLRESTRGYMASLLTLSGVPKEEAFARALNIFMLEEEIASSRKSETTEDANGRKKPEVTLEDPALYKNLHPEEILQEMGFLELEKTVIYEPKTLKTMDALFTQDNLQIIKDYTVCTLLGNVSNILSKELKKIHSTFLEQNGIYEESLTEQGFAEKMIMQFMGNAIEKRYAAVAIKEQDIKEVTAITELIRQSFEKRIRSSTLFTEETKEEALQKLYSIRIKVGTSHRYRDYSFLQISSLEQESNLFTIYRQIKRNELQEAQTALLNPVYKNEWHIPAYAVNAVYSPLYNDIVIPAGILQEPFYSYNQTLEQKLGGIGSVIAHEMSHAFYGNGSRYDRRGNEVSWWSMEDYTSFYQRTNRIAAYFSDIEIMPEVFINGENTLNEGIADISGLTCVIDILEEGKSSYNKSLFFETYAKCFAMRADDSYVLFDALSKEHLPMAARVNAIVNLFDAFYQAYQVKEKDGMFLPKEKRVSVW